jgi:hypothetical protein
MQRGLVAQKHPPHDWQREVCGSPQQSQIGMQGGST